LKKKKPPGSNNLLDNFVHGKLLGSINLDGSTIALGAIPSLPPGFIFPGVEPAAIFRRLPCHPQDLADW